MDARTVTPTRTAGIHRHVVPPSQVSLSIDGLGPTLLVHGSPRSDEECVTPRTPDERVARVHGRRAGAASS